MHKFWTSHTQTLNVLKPYNITINLGMSHVYVWMNAVVDGRQMRTQLA